MSEPAARDDATLWCSASPTWSARYPDAALLSWTPSSAAAGKVSRCAFTGALLTFEYKRRLFDKSDYEKSPTTTIESWAHVQQTTAFRQARHQVLRDAALRVMKCDSLGHVPFHFSVISDGIFWFFCTVRFSDNGATFVHQSMRRCSEVAGVFADLCNIMVLSLRRPTYDPSSRVGTKELWLRGHRFEVQQWLGGTRVSHVFLCRVTKNHSADEAEHGSGQAEHGSAQGEWVVMKVRSETDSGNAVPEEAEG